MSLIEEFEFYLLPETELPDMNRELGIRRLHHPVIDVWKKFSQKNGRSWGGGAKTLREGGRDWLYCRGRLDCTGLGATRLLVSLKWIFGKLLVGLGLLVRCSPGSGNGSSIC